MFEIKNDNMIHITKGDSAAIKLVMKETDGSYYNWFTGDMLVMTVRKKINSEVLMTKTSTSNVIDLTPTDTKKLEVGLCFYDIEFQSVTGDIFTVAGARDSMMPNMKVYPEVTV